MDFLEKRDVVKTVRLVGAESTIGQDAITVSLIM